jgi:hypothetical protein
MQTTREDLMKEIKDYLGEFEKLLPIGKSVSPVEAERRAGQFLVALATIANYRHLFSEDRIRSTSIQSAVYAEELSKCEGSTITANKITVEASGPYTSAREGLERTENDLSYLKAFQEIFMNAHVFYRNLAKGENG